jgi:hypothetical protein
MNPRAAASVLSKKSRNEKWPALTGNTVGEPQPSKDYSQERKE